MKLRTTFKLLKFLAAVALVGWPLLLAFGCKTTEPITIPAPIPFTSLR